MGWNHTAELRRVRDSSSGEREWEFACECGRRNCTELVFLTLDAYAALHDGNEGVLADGHRESEVVRARRLVEEAEALQGQAEHQVRRARKNLGKR